MEFGRRKPTKWTEVSEGRTGNSGKAAAQPASWRASCSGGRGLGTWASPQWPRADPPESGKADPRAQGLSQLHSEMR